MKKTKEQFVSESKLIHGDKFDYSKFEYLGSKVKSILICNDCGVEFKATPSNLLQGKSCKNCYNIERGLNHSKKKLEDKYSNIKFDFTGYVNNESEIKYVCSRNHYNVSNYKNLIRQKTNICEKCFFIENIENKQSNIKVIEYVDNDDIVCECKNCGFELKDSYRNFTRKEYKCKYCEIMEVSNRFDSGELILDDVKNGKIYFHCKKENHEYIMSRRNFLRFNNAGCNECRRFTLDDIKEKINEIHGNRFKYDFSNFKSVHTKINIICENGHNFKQKISNHLQGKGCAVCNESFGERFISLYLERNGIEYEKQKTFDDCIYQDKLKFDFYIPEKNMLIEFDGIQHFEPIDHFGGMREFKKQIKKDEIKNRYCLDKNIDLIRIKYNDDIDVVLDKFIIFVN